MKSTLNKDKMHFCARFLKRNGITSGIKYMQLLDMLEDNDPEFMMTRIGTKEEGYFDELAVGLIDIWPEGDKITDRGRFRWRDTIQNTKTRLQVVFKERNLQNVPVESVLQIARMYVSQFNADRKYMKILKRWIIDKDNLKGTYTSLLADAIESMVNMNIPEETVDEETGEVLPVNGGGRLC